MKIPRVKIISKSTGPAKAKKVALNLQTLSKLFMKIKELKIKFKPTNQPTNQQTNSKTLKQVAGSFHMLLLISNQVFNLEWGGARGMGVGWGW